MDLDKVFPGLKSSVIPRIVAKIFFSVSYTESIRSLRLVSSSWRDFIDHELLGKPHVRARLRNNQFVHAWTKRPPVKTALAELADHSVTISDDHVFVIGRYKTDVYYKNLQHVGFIVRNSQQCQDSSPFMSCNEFFVHLKYSDPPKLQAYGKQEDDAQQFQPCQLSPTLRLEGRTILDMKSTTTGDRKPILVCKSDNKIVVIDMSDGGERVVDVSRSCPDRPPVWSTIFKFDCAADDKELLLFWEKDRLLLFIDHGKVEELWAKDLSDCCRSIAKRKKYTCLVEESIEDRSRSFLIFDNSCGRLITAISTTRSIGLLSTWNHTLTDDCVVWISKADLSSHVHVFNVDKGRVVASMSARMFACHACFLFGCWLGWRFLDMSAERVAIAEWVCSCRSSNLSTLDLLQRPPSVPKTVYFVKKVRDVGVYEAQVSGGLVLCRNAVSNCHELLDFYYT